MPGAHDAPAGAPSNLSSLAAQFAQRVPRSVTVFLASYRADLDGTGLAAFRLLWDDVHALALYDWNGAGLQGRQFSSAINRLVCAKARRVHWPDGVKPRAAGCW